MSDTEQDDEKHTLDLSKKQLKKVPRQEDAQNVRKLLLDDNELQKIDNIDSYLKIETLSLSKNQLLRMYGVSRLHCLRELNLSFNGILSIEGLKDCVHLRHLNLESNKIKTIEHLATNTQLEYLNLADNQIGSISDMSYLKNLKELYMHGNRLTHLRACDKYLPTSLEVLSLAKNNINDLNEICTLGHLCNLQSISIAENPCVTMTLGPNSLDGFDHRPFVLNWCLSVKVIDGYIVDPIESLKAEWLYSQGRGRQFRVGEQPALAKYLSTVCPLVGKALENENERKLRLILSKAQHHQRQLQEEIMDNANSSASNSPSSNRKKPASRIQSPRFSRLSGRQGSPESMISSYHGNTTAEHANNSSNHGLQMSTSLIENMKNDISADTFSLLSSGMSSSVTTKTYNSQESTPRNITPNPYNEQSFINQNSSNIGGGGPLAAASKMVPVPETLMSPDVCPSTVAQRVAVNAISTQIQNTKISKNKDNKLNSPRVRSPHLRRTQSPTTSPRKQNNSNVQQQHGRHQRIASGGGVPLQQQQHVESRSGLISNSVHVSTCGADADSTGFSSDDDSEQFSIDKLKTIRNKAAQRTQQQQQQQNNMQTQRLAGGGVDVGVGAHETETSAVVIQKIWRGYRTRKKNKDIAEKLQKQRTYEYIDKLTKDMEMTKAQLENERKIQQLQMQAINALWKKVSTMQQHQEPRTTSDGGGGAEVAETVSSGQVSLDNDAATVVQDLAKSCTILTSQVQQLQNSMHSIVNCLTMVCNLPQDTIKRLINSDDMAVTATTGTDDTHDTASTQTEIIAVHTPQLQEEEQKNVKFPFAKMQRPSTLPLASAVEVPTLSNQAVYLTTEQQMTSDVEQSAPEDIDDIAAEEEEDVNEIELQTDQMESDDVRSNSSTCRFDVETDEKYDEDVAESGLD